MYIVNQKDSYVIGYLIVEGARSEETAVSFVAKSNIHAAEKLLKDNVLKKQKMEGIGCHNQQHNAY